MTDEEWNEVFEVFHAAREKSGVDRVRVLDAACGEGTELRAVVEELLREDEAANGFLSVPLFVPFSQESDLSPTAAGTHVGRYVTIARIGRGGMGEVWSAQDTDLDRLVALKFLSSKTLQGLDPQLIIREAKTASALNHPGIVTIHEVIQFKDSTALVMELVEGKPLRELCGKPMPIPEVLEIALQITEALGAAHAHGTIHGDIKPENILLRPDHYVKLLDFGLARKVTAEKTGLEILAALGTLRYMSPEQARGETLTPASDIFSFGLVLYELLTGQHAFPALVPLDTAQGILNKEPVSPSSLVSPLPKRLELLVLSMLAKEPGARPSITIVQETLSRLLKAQNTGRGFTGLARQSGIAVFLLAVACLAGWRWKENRIAGIAEFRQITTLIPENRATAAAISLDGKWAAYANVDGIFLRVLPNGATRALAAPDDFAVDRLAWFNDGTKLLACGFSRSTTMPSIWIIPINGGPPRLLRGSARWATPSPDGTQVAFISGDRSEIWTMTIDGERQQKVVSAGSDDYFDFVLWSPDARRLSFERQLPPQAGFDQQYETVDLSSGKVDVLAKNLYIRSPAMLNDGRLMFLKWDTDDYTSAHELWEVRTNVASGALQGKPSKVAALAGDGTISMLGLSVTASGKQAMALVQSSQRSVFVADFDARIPRLRNIHRLTLDDHTNFPHAWTADSRSVIFESNRNGDYDLFKQRIDQRTPETIVATPMTEILPQLTPDGHFVLYAGHDAEDEHFWFYHAGTYKLMRVSLEGGAPQEVPIGGKLDEFRCPLGSGRHCVLRTSVPGKWRMFYDLDPVRGKGRELARTSWFWELLGDWDVSPDGTEVVLPNHSPREARIRIVSLDPKPNQPGEREVLLPGVTDLRGLAWAADGKGWFVSMDTTLGHQLLYATLDGRFWPLADIESVAVPSPDGRHLAFVNSIAATNAWLIERKQ